MPAAKRAEICSWLEAIRQRQRSYSFRLVGSRLKAVGFPTATGWDGLLAKARNLPLNDRKIDLDAFLDEVRSIYVSSLWHGKSATFLFEISEGYPSAIFTRLPSLIDASSPFRAAFPRPLTTSALARASFTPTFIASDRQDDRLLFVASCKRAFKEREEVDRSSLDPAAQQALEEFDEVYAVRRGFVQAFDRIIFNPRARRVELHIDMCDLLSTEELVSLAHKYRDKLNDAGAYLQAGNFLSPPKNLYSKIAEFYNSDEGNVISLGHATGTKSVKEERMRDKMLDLRKELFHEKGIQAIRTTDAFSVKKGWSSAFGNTPNITIPGSFLIVGAPLPVVSYAILDSCKDGQDFTNLVSKLW